MKKSFSIIFLALLLISFAAAENLTDNSTDYNETEILNASEIINNTEVMNTTEEIVLNETEALILNETEELVLNDSETEEVQDTGIEAEYILEDEEIVKEPKETPAEKLNKVASKISESKAMNFAMKNINNLRYGVGGLIILLVIIFLVNGTNKMKLSRARRLHKKAQKYHANGNYGKSQKLYAKASILREEVL